MMENQSISKNERMDYGPGRDLLSELPLSIIHVILALVPFKDAVQTSALSREWRYTWTTLPYLIFEYKCQSLDYKRSYRFKERMKNMITHALFRHKGPIQKFQLSVSSSPRICLTVDEWVLCLSRNDIKELILYMSDIHCCWSKVHSSIYSCNKLTNLELFNCIMDPPPPTFKGFLFLKCLFLVRVTLSPDEIESLVASSPLLERFGLNEYRNPKLRISAPKLKYLEFSGAYVVMCLYAPQLDEMSVELTDDEFTNEHLQQKASVCNYTSFFGDFTNLEKFNGDLFFTKFLSIGIESCQCTLVFHRLKDIDLNDVNFEDEKEILAIARLITSAPNLHRLYISTNSGSLEEDDIAMFLSDSESTDECFVDFGFAPADFTFEKLRFVRMTDVIGFHSEVDFMKVLLERSPVLETMNVVHVSALDAEKKERMSDKLLSCCWASPNAKLVA